jgi:hypothetical protein
VSLLFIKTCFSGSQTAQYQRLGDVFELVRDGLDILFDNAIASSFGEAYTFSFSLSASCERATNRVFRGGHSTVRALYPLPDGIMSSEEKRVFCEAAYCAANASFPFTRFRCTDDHGPLLLVWNALCPDITAGSALISSIRHHFKSRPLSRLLS